MASFVSNKRTRTTEKAIHQKSRVRNALSTTGLPACDDTKFLSKGGAIRSQAHVVTTIGSSNSKGLAIQGYREDNGYQFPRNLAATTEPFGVSSPSFPVSYTGTGYLDFINGFAVPYIIGSTEIKGNLLVSGSIIAKNSFSSPAATFVPVVTDGIGGTLTVTSTQASYKTTDFLDYFEMCVMWSDHTLDVNEQIRIEGLPLSSYSPYGFSPMVPDYGVYTTNVGATIYGNVQSATDYLVLTESDTTSSLIRQPLLGSHFEKAGDSPGGGSFCMSGWLSKI